MKKQTWKAAVSAAAIAATATVSARSLLYYYDFDAVEDGALVINRMANAGKLPADLENVPMLGYADAVIETPKEVCVFEFKYRKSAKAAIKQIRERGYADKWIGGDRPVTLVGINFNPKKRNIDMPIIEKV